MLEGSRRRSTESPFSDRVGPSQLVEVPVFPVHEVEPFPVLFVRARNSLELRAVGQAKRTKDELVKVRISNRVEASQELKKFRLLQISVAR